MTTLLNEAGENLRPGLVPCRVTTEMFTTDVDSIPGAAASAAMLRCEYGLPAWWQPIADSATVPYAFVALGMRMHAVWFAVQRLVDRFETTACGTEFDTLCEPLLGRAVAPCTIGPCEHCLTLWRAHYGN